MPEEHPQEPARRGAAPAGVHRASGTNNNSGPQERPHAAGRSARRNARAIHRTLQCTAYVFVTVGLGGQKDLSLSFLTIVSRDADGYAPPRQLQPGSSRARRAAHFVGFVWRGTSWGGHYLSLPLARPRLDALQ